MKRITLIIAAGLLSMSAGVTYAQEAEADAASEARFTQERNQQQNMLNQARAERTRQENESARLEQTFEENQQSIITARQQLDERLGALKELFGVLQTVSGDTQGRFNGSLTNLQHPDREAFLVRLGSKMASATELAQIEDIEQLWFMLQQEITLSGTNQRFNQLVTRADGTQAEMPVVRVGTLNLIADVGYLEHDAGEGSVSELLRQPDGRFTGSASDLFDAESGYVNFGIDVTRGGILGLLVETPTLGEKVDQGGIVGYSILALGAVGLLIAIWRFMGLTSASNKVRAQLKRDSASTDNPLGRVLAAYESNRNADTETIELKLSEAALKEMPGLTKGLLFIKVISVVAPLMGLLGTVTGMIKTFQVITLYGAGDPKMMAGGISQALVTTVLGLVVAIPMVLLHTIVSGQSRKIVNILQSQSAGLIAQHSEKSG
jgi:biopolymer transport protein ExbB